MKKLIRSVIASAVMLPFLTATALADGPLGGGINPGERIGQWIQTNVAALFAPLIGVVALYYLARREFTKFLSFAAFAVLVALFVFGGTEFKDAAVSLSQWVIGK